MRPGSGASTFPVRPHSLRNVAISDMIPPMSASENVAKSDITPEQSRAARGLLDWSRDQLAEAAGIPKRTIMRFEGREVEPRGSTLAGLRAAFEAAGVLFVSENGEGPGVRLRKGVHRLR